MHHQSPNVDFYWRKIKRIRSLLYFSSVVLVNFRNMGRSGAAKNKQLRENRQDLVQNLLAGKSFRDMLLSEVME